MTVRGIITVRNSPGVACSRVGISAAIVRICCVSVGSGGGSAGVLPRLRFGIALLDRGCLQFGAAARLLDRVPDRDATGWGRWPSAAAGRRVGRLLH